MQLLLKNAAQKVMNIYMEREEMGWGGHLPPSPPPPPPGSSAEILGGLCKIPNFSSLYVGIYTPCLIAATKRLI